MFYAVRRGRNTGVYYTWDQCKDQVDRFPSARFKKFASKEEAWNFVRDTQEADFGSVKRSCDVYRRTWHRKYHERPSYHTKRPFFQSTSSFTNNWTFKQIKRYDNFFLPSHGQSLTRSCDVPSSSMNREYHENPSYRAKRPLPQVATSSTNNRSSKRIKRPHTRDTTVVYTDGCCSQNGRVKAQAGIGVYWGHRHPLNVAERLEGRQTNQRAEIQAACRAIEQARSQNITKLALKTDSMFTINGITKWIHSWKRNGWKRSNGEEVTNRKDFEKLDRLTRGMNIKWKHIPGHAGIRGNEKADKLARKGAKTSARKQRHVI